MAPYAPISSEGKSSLQPFPPFLNSQQAICWSTAPVTITVNPGRDQSGMEVVLMIFMFDFANILCRMPFSLCIYPDLELAQEDTGLCPLVVTLILYITEREVKMQPYTVSLSLHCG